MVIIHGKYRHYKNKKLYEIQGTAIHTETYEEMVIYKGLYVCEKFGANPVWVRPLKMFIEHVEDNIPRFTLVEE